MQRKSQGAIARGAYRVHRRQLVCHRGQHSRLNRRIQGGALHKPLDDAFGIVVHLVGHHVQVPQVQISQHRAAHLPQAKFGYPEDQRFPVFVKPDQHMARPMRHL